MIGKTIDELEVGQTARFSKTITETDIYLFAGVTGDLNPAHVDEEYAKKTRYGSIVAIPSFFATIFPGYVQQGLQGRSPMKWGRS